MLCPVNHFNFVRNLEHAAKQATRKASWLKDNLESVAIELDINTEDSQLKIVAIVILNQRLGSGLVVADATITDCFLWNLYFSDSQYSSGAARTKEQTAVTFTTFYNGQADAEASLVDTFQKPPPLKAYLDGETWTTTEFPTAFGPILLEMPGIGSGALVTGDLAAAAELVMEARR